MANTGGKHQDVSGAQRMFAIGPGEYDVAAQHVNADRAPGRVLGKNSAGRKTHEREPKRAFLDERARRSSMLLQQRRVERELIAAEPMKENRPARLPIE